MVSAAPLLLMLSWVAAQAIAEVCRGTRCYGAETGDPRPCTGAHCPGSRSSRAQRQFHPAAQEKTAHAFPGPQHLVYLGSPRAASDFHPAAQTPRGRNGGADARGGEPQVPPARCADGDCGASARSAQLGNDTRDCRGIECRLPPRIRPKPRVKSCVGEECLTASAESVSSAAATSGHFSPVHLSDRAAQFLGDFPELGYPSPELGSAPLGVQLTCDIKPGLLSLSLSCSCVLNVKD